MFFIPGADVAKSICPSDDPSVAILNDETVLASRHQNGNIYNEASLYIRIYSSKISNSILSLLLREVFFYLIPPNSSTFFSRSNAGTFSI